MQKWHRHSLFGAGPRRPLNREARARFRYLLNAHRRARRITPLAEHIGTALLKRLSVDGQCDPSHDTLAADVGCSARTVRRAIVALRRLGLVGWQQRIIRAGWRVLQTSSAYVLAAAGTPPAAPIRTGGQSVPPIRKLDIRPMSPPPRSRLEAALERLGWALNGPAAGRSTTS
jgi:hypothetical protein